MKLYTYYVDCPAHAGRGEVELVELWQRNWNSIGVETSVLNLAHAKYHPYFEEFDKAVSVLPSVNSKEYELACFHRWLALACVGGGFMSDYDVFAKPSADIKALEAMAGDDLGRLHIFQEPQVCPSLVYATPEVILKVCRQFATGDYGLRKIGKREHYSDMYALYDMFYHSGTDMIRLHDVVRDYPADGWQKYDLIHFNNSGMARCGNLPKFLHVERLLQ